MKALIICDDVTLAADTNAILHRVAHRADMAVNRDIRPWRLNMLKLPATAGRALHDAVDAHLIVFAVRRINKLHIWLMNWLFATAITPQCRQPNLRVSDFAVSNLIFAIIREREKTKSERDSLRA
jgi:hypothetical protein